MFDTYMKLREILGLSAHLHDTFVGVGPKYPWGGLYGGQIVAQALSASAHTVDPDLDVHSLRSYFIRRGDPDQPVRYEVERIRDGKSFCTRRVVARQAGGVILHLESSFQRAEGLIDVETIKIPAGIPPPDTLADDAWSDLFHRRWIPEATFGAGAGAGAGPGAGQGAGRATAWLKAREMIGDEQLLQRCVLAYLSDDLPGDAATRAHPIGKESSEIRHDAMFLASLDHSIWFHRPVRTDEWHLHDVACHSFVGGRGLTIGHVFGIDGTHVATMAQEVLLRDNRDR